MDRPLLDGADNAPQPPVALPQRLRALSAELVGAAQAVLDEWQADEHGIDEEFGTGGACDAISSAMSSVIGSSLDVEVIDGGHDGDDHAFLIVQEGQEQVVVDIPPSVYETGGGFHWTKKAGVSLTSADLVIEPLPGPSISL